MSILDDLLNCGTYKAVFLYDSKSAYIWRNGECSYFHNLSREQADRLLEMANRATRKFKVNGVAFGFTS